MKYKNLALSTLVAVTLVTTSGAAFAIADQSIASSAAATSIMQKEATMKDTKYWFTTKYDETAAMPGFSMGAPVGMTASWGVVFGGLGGLTNTPTANNTDGSGSIGFGLGDSIKQVGATVTLGLGSIHPKDGGSMNRGNLGLAIGKFFVKTQTAVAVGATNLGGWNGGGGNPTPSYYVAATQIIPINNFPIIVNAGVGNNAYSFQKATTPSNINKRIAPFGSVAVYLLPQINLIADYTAGALSLGTSIVPVASWPVTVTLGAYDVFKYVPNHTSVSFTGSIAYSYVF